MSLSLSTTILMNSSFAFPLLIATPHIPHSCKYHSFGDCAVSLGQNTHLDNRKLFLPLGFSDRKEQEVEERISSRLHDY